MMELSQQSHKTSSLGTRVTSASAVRPCDGTTLPSPFYPPSERVEPRRGEGPDNETWLGAMTGRGESLPARSSRPSQRESEVALSTRGYSCEHRVRAVARRPGSMFVETAIGIALAAVVMISVAQLVALAAKQRREVAQRQIATQEVANLLEHVVVMPWDDLTEESTSELKLSNDLASQLAEPELAISVSQTDDELPTKKVEVTLSWRDQANRRVAPVRLVGWRHQRLGDSEAEE